MPDIDILCDSELLTHWRDLCRQSARLDPQAEPQAWGTVIRRIESCLAEFERRSNLVTVDN